MALSEDFRISSENISEISPRKRAPRALIPITARELVEWTYAVQRAQGVPDTQAERQEWSQTGIVIGRLIDFANLGCRVDVSSNAAVVWGETRCHEDALTVHTIVDGMRTEQRGKLRGPLTAGAAQLIEHGRYRSIPDWNPKIFPLRCVPVPGNRSNPRGIYLRHSNEQIGCEITYEGDWPSRDFAMQARIAGDAHRRAWAERREGMRVQRRARSVAGNVEHDWARDPLRRCADEVLAHAREIYCQWYEALWAFCDGLDAVGPLALTRYRISGLGAAYEPWRV